MKTTHPRFAGMLALMLGMGLVHAGETPPVIGEISFVIGGAWRQTPDGQSHALTKGTPLRAGDRLETADNGHAHVQFVDGARLSLRPRSRLQIETYRYDPSAPRESAIRLNLEEGNARSITGRGGEAARERFRLNTPLAAIGIRGTDFIVSADPEHTRVKVESGAVVVAPLGSSGCQANAFGPCSGGAARLLTAEMGGVMLEIKRQQDAPRLIPAPAGTAQSSPPAAGSTATAQSGGSGGSEATTRPQPVSAVTAPASVPVAATPPAADPIVVRPPELANETRGRDTLATIAKPAPSEPAPPPEVTPKPPVVVAPPVVETPPPVVVAPEPAPVPQPVPPVTQPVPPVTTPPARPQLAWGRWSWVADKPGASLLESYASASSDRKIAVGNQEVGLFRTEDDGRFHFPANLGEVGFSLAAVNAWVSDGKRTEAAITNNGSLAINFSGRSFTTHLDLYHKETGLQPLNASGSISNGGVLLGGGPGSTVTGAISYDRNEAGYYFTQTAGPATFSGVTLWKR